MAKDVLQKHDLAFFSRSIPDAIHAHNQFKYSVVWLPVGHTWRSLRKALNANMFSGARLDVNQHLRRRKVEELIDYCRRKNHSGEAVDVGRAAFRTSLNLLSNTIFSKDLADPFSDSGKEFRELVWSMMMEAGKPNLVDFFPFLQKLDPQGIRRRMTVHFGTVIGLVGGFIDERLEKGKRNSNGGASDVIDVLLAACKENTDDIDRTLIERMCLDLFVAGTDTSSNTVEWAMAEALANPDTMRNVMIDFDGRRIGSGRGRLGLKTARNLRH